MHKQGSKSFSWRLAIVVALATVFILALSWFQLIRTLDAIRVSSQKQQQQQQQSNQDNQQHENADKNVEQDDSQAHDLGRDQLANLIDLHNPPPNHLARGASNKLFPQHVHAPAHDRSNNDKEENNFNNQKTGDHYGKSPSSEVKVITPRLVKSLAKFHSKGAQSTRDADAFITRFAEPDVSSSSSVAKLDVELFVIWFDALDKAHRILADIRKKFYVVAIDYFDWSPERMNRGDFETNLWRLYSGKGGWERVGMAKKVEQCGYGPFIAIVVVDPEPTYAVERTAHGDDTVNHNMNAAKKLYRSWSGGGFRVHGTFGPLEAEHDIPLLFHRPKEDFARVYVKLLDEANKETAVSHVGGQQKSYGYLMVENFVNNIRLFSSSSSASALANLANSSSSSSSAALDSVGSVVAAATASVIKPKVIDFENEGLSPWRELSPILAKQSTCRTHKTWQLGNGREVRHRDHVFRNEYLTTRETLGIRGWASCRDFLLLLKTYIDTKLIVSITTGRSSDVFFDLPKLECTPCTKWPSTLEIRLDEKIRWAVGSLVASSAARNVFANGQKGSDARNSARERQDVVRMNDATKSYNNRQVPVAFEEVPFFVDDGHNVKKISIWIKNL